MSRALRVALLWAQAGLWGAGTAFAQAKAPPVAPPPERVPPPLERPQTVPTRDAVLGYHLAPAAGEAINVRVTMRAGGKGLRMDLPDQTYMVSVPATRSVVLVVPLERTVADLFWADGPQPLFTVDDRMMFIRKGEATIAGQRCAQWEGVLDKARSLLCVTGDGLVLRNQFQDPQGRRNVVEAFVVQFEPARDADFTVPAGFERLLTTPGPTGSK